MATKDWVKNKYNSWHKKDGIELESYGSKTIYPFIQIGTYYNSEIGKDEGFQIMLHTSHHSKLLKRTKTKSQALKFAKSYMRTH